MFIYSYIICLFRECVRKKKKHFNTILIGAAFTIIQILYLLCYIFLCAERICLIQTKERNEKAMMDVLMFLTFFVCFGLMKLLADWCEKQVRVPKMEGQEEEK